MTDPAFEKLPFRPCVGIMLVDRRNLVLVARRIDMPSEAWQMPQGGIDVGESVEEAAFRELREEIGTDNADIVAVSDIWRKYDLPEKLKGKLWRGRFRGQMQKWVLMRFLGSDADIDLDTEEPEFLAWKWAVPEEVPNLIVPFKRDIYREVVAEFRPLIG